MVFRNTPNICIVSTGTKIWEDFIEITQFYRKSAKPNILYEEYWAQQIFHKIV